MDTKKLYQEKMDAQIKQLDARIDVLRAEAEKAKADVKISLQKQIENLEKKREEAKNRLREVKAAGQVAWEELKAGMDNAIKELEQAVVQATSKFK